MEDRAQHLEKKPDIGRQASDKGTPLLRLGWTMELSGHTLGFTSTDRTCLQFKSRRLEAQLSSTLQFTDTESESSSSGLPLPWNISPDFRKGSDH